MWIRFEGNTEPEKFKPPVTSDYSDNEGDVIKVTRHFNMERFKVLKKSEFKGEALLEVSQVDEG